MLKTLSLSSWHDSIQGDSPSELTQDIEDGSVLFFPRLSFELSSEEQVILTPNDIGKTKNISFNRLDGTMRGVSPHISSERSYLIKSVLNRFVDSAFELINKIFPTYANNLQIGRTSFRPVEILGRVSSYRKDDTRLHVDAFPSNPNQGRRILRIFSNINPNNKPRVWRLGEPFEAVANQFLPRIRKRIPGYSRLLHLLKLTKSYRTAYDHVMLQLHDTMKGDEKYQHHAPQQTIDFPAQSTWIVQTDHVSHAAMSGQYMLEQTFYLPFESMLDPNKSPVKVLERLMGKVLV